VKETEQSELYPKSVRPENAGQVGELARNLEQAKLLRNDNTRSREFTAGKERMIEMVSDRLEIPSRASFGKLISQKENHSVSLCIPTNCIYLYQSFEWYLISGILSAVLPKYRTVTRGYRQLKGREKCHSPSLSNSF
jgi:hypothetical protein